MDSVKLNIGKDSFELQLVERGRAWPFSSGRIGYRAQGTINVNGQTHSVSCLLINRHQERDSKESKTLKGKSKAKGVAQTF